MSDNTGFDRALDGTAYWTLSLYIAAESLAGFYGEQFTADPGQALRAAQLRHKPSFALRNAIDPLFNDIADRDFFGRPRDFLFAAGLGAADGAAGWEIETAGAALRNEVELEFVLPQQFSWVTEGIRFNCDLGEATTNRLKLRRFWFAHSDGALSYHLSFEHRYKDRAGANPRDVLHDPYGLQTYYFLSLLQKLAAPKEFMLGKVQLERLASAGAFVNPYHGDDTGIDPLDRIMVRKTGGDAVGQRFWRYVRDSFVADARILLGEIFELPVARSATDHQLDALPEMSEVIEVPGLKLPRCRYLFHIDDRRFFDRLLPVDPLTGEGLPRKQMVREQCFVPFRAMIDGLTRPEAGPPPPEVWLGSEEGQSPALRWTDFDLTAEYAKWIAAGVFIDEAGRTYPDEPALKRALHAGTARLTCDDDGNPIDPAPLHIPAYETGRSDCLDYLFLAGFNQNIIDWLNQDTSEILDSTDPIYPTEEVQADERFFIRYANQRGMITYVAKSRSLEIGNDYIGTCPYAFLIHVLALHNEFLARDHERRSHCEIDDIDRQIELVRANGAKAAEATLRDIEEQVNRLKRATYRDYERHRYLNIFRYDTEQVVFARLAELRGTEWRGTAMTTALATLEEYAADLDRRARHQAVEDRRKADDKAAAREKRLGRLGGALAAIGGISILSNLADYAEKHPHFGPPGREPWLSYALGNLAWVLVIVGLAVMARLGWLHRRELWQDWRRSLLPQSNRRRSKNQDAQ